MGDLFIPSTWSTLSDLLSLISYRSSRLFSIFLFTHLPLLLLPPNSIYIYDYLACLYTYYLTTNRLVYLRVCVCNSSATPIRVETMQNFYFAHEPSEINSKRIKTFSRTGLDSTSLPSCYKLNHHHPLVILVVTFLLVLRNPCTVHCSSMHIVASSW